ncbi:hypothetical protein PIB30_009695 [Stylosanthes scabra]|uniref:Uncharacterized protein n=1 Tax=Stylosanthes scabra TaxID=79078 RepID=A0ABU6V703_9FABA|nr:hypothetical protein [Stylosanthes scabra]
MAEKGRRGKCEEGGDLEKLREHAPSNVSFLRRNRSRIRGRSLKRRIHRGPDVSACKLINLRSSDSPSSISSGQLFWIFSKHGLRPQPSPTRDTDQAEELTDHPTYTHQKISPGMSVTLSR